MLKRTYRCFLILSIAAFLLASSLALKPEDLGKPWDEVARLINDRNYAGAIGRLHDYAKSSSEVERLAEIYYRIGFINHLYIHDYDEALDAYRKVVGLDNKAKSSSDLETYTALSQMSIAEIYRRIGQYDDAIKMYGEVRADYAGKDYAEVAARHVEGIQDALAEIRLQQQVIDKYPNTEFAAEAQFVIAGLYLSAQNLNNPQRAIQEYAKLVHDYSNSRRVAEAQLEIGNAYRMYLNKPVAAIAAYQKLVQGQFAAGKLAAEALFQIGRAYYRELRDFRKALDAFNRLLEEHPTYWKLPAAIYWQGMCYEELGEYDRSVESFNTLIQVYPDEIPNWLADIGKLGEKNVKAKIESKVEKLKQQAPEARWRDAERLRSEEMFREALVAYRELMGKYPHGEYSQKARTQAKSVGKLAEMQIYKDMIEKGGVEAPAAQYRIAEMYQVEVHDDARAITEYEKVAEKYSNTHWAADALYRIGLIHSGLDPFRANSLTEESKTDERKKTDYDAAIRSYRQLIQKYPDTYNAAEAHYQIGEIRRAHLGDYDRALTAYRNVLEDYPRRNFYVGEGYRDSLADRAHFKIGRIYYENLHDYDMALGTFTKFLDDYPDSCRKAAAYSFIAAIQENQETYKAADSLERVIDIIVASDVQSSFFIRDAHYVDGTQESGLRGFDLQRHIIRRLRQKVVQLRGQD